MEENASKVPLTYSLFPARDPGHVILPLSSASSHAKFSEPILHCHKITELMIIKESIRAQ